MITVSRSLAFLVAVTLALTCAAVEAEGVSEDALDDLQTDATTDLVPVTEYNLLGGQFNLVSVRSDEVFFTAGNNCLGRLDAARAPAQASGTCREWQVAGGK